MASRTENKLAKCVERLQRETTLKQELMAAMHAEGASLAQIQAALARGGLAMSRSGIRQALVRQGIQTSRTA